MTTKQMLRPEGHVVKFNPRFRIGGEKIYTCETCSKIFNENECTAREVEGE